jgi:hypothetical protein
MSGLKTKKMPPAEMQLTGCKWGMSACPFKFWQTSRAAIWCPGGSAENFSFGLQFDKSLDHGCLRRCSAAFGRHLKEFCWQPLHQGLKLSLSWEKSRDLAFLAAEQL